MRDKSASSADVARKAGVSRTTVSFVINNAPGKSIPEETRRRVLEAAHELRYVPNESARSVAMIKHHSIGFFIPHAGYLSSDAYIVRVIEGMAPVLNKHRFQLVLQPLSVQEMDYRQIAQTDNVDGVILMNTHDDDKGLAQIIEADFPLVVIGTISNPEVIQIDIDNRSAAAAAVNYLIDLGHRDIGMVVHAPLSYYAARDRYEGYRAAMQGAGLEVRGEWVREANLTAESGYQAAREIVGGRNRPTALFVGNDVVAYGAIQAIKDALLSIPDDISVVGFDDDSISRYLNPPLTTMTNPAAGFGAEAARLLIGALKGRPRPARPTILPITLAVRGSCRSL